MRVRVQQQEDTAMVHSDQPVSQKLSQILGLLDIRYSATMHLPVPQVTQTLTWMTVICERLADS